jgi:hypothetical protein
VAALSFFLKVLPVPFVWEGYERLLLVKVEVDEVVIERRCVACGVFQATKERTYVASAPSVGAAR